MLVRVYTCQNTTLLEITCAGSLMVSQDFFYAFSVVSMITNNLFVLLLYVPSQQLWSLRDGQFT